MTTLYGNLVDAALGEARYAGESADEPALSASPFAERILVALALGLLGLAVLIVWDAVSVRFAAATPALADLENWLLLRGLPAR